MAGGPNCTGRNGISIIKQKREAHVCKTLPLFYVYINLFIIYESKISGRLS